MCVGVVLTHVLLIGSHHSPWARLRCVGVISCIPWAALDRHFIRTGGTRRAGALQQSAPAAAADAVLCWCAAACSSNLAALTLWVAAHSCTVGAHSMPLTHAVLALTPCNRVSWSCSACQSCCHAYTRALKGQARRYSLCSTWLRQHGTQG